MKRFVSYLYSIYNNQKIHNAGFARVELRTGRNRVDIHLKENGYAGKTGTVYLFIRKRENIQGISIGNLAFRNNQAEFRYEQTEENIGQTPWKIMQMNGILILIDGRAAFLSQWDEQPVDTTRFEIWKADGQSEIKGAEQADRKDAQEQDTNDKNGLETQVQSSEKPEPAPEAVPNPVQETMSNPAQGAMPKLAPETMANPAQKAMPSPAQKVMPSPMQKAMPNPAPEMMSNPAQGAMPKLAPETMTNPAPETATNMKKVNNAANTSINSYEHQEQTEDAAAFEMNVQAEADTKHDTEQASNVRTAELKPQMQDSWSQNWRYMLRTFPVMNQFKDEYQVLCVRIEIKDMRLLPEKYWSMINKSFLLHGFFNYRYLVFGRIGQNWFVGVPGIYQNQEHVMASIFGFPDFLPQKQKNERGEQPGYWYRTLEAV